MSGGLRRDEARVAIGFHVMVEMEPAVVAGMAVIGMAAFGIAGCECVEEKAAPPEADAQQPQTQRPQAQQQPRTLQDTTGWRARMQQNHNAAQSIEEQVSRLTRDLDLTPAQQETVRKLAWDHNKIQAILDTAPPALAREDFTVQVHAISKEFHDSVNAILTPHQLELMKAMVGRLGSGLERRRAP